jgi:flagellar biosynthesis chaperone FliJ
MISRLKALSRLASLYDVLEHANSIALDQARASLHDVDQRIREREASTSRLASASRDALATGDVSEWLLSQSERVFVRWNAPALEKIRQQRVASVHEAAEIYQISRMQLEQMQSVVERVRATVELERERAEQRASDDRYLSRRSWELDAEQRRIVSENRTAKADVKALLDLPQ